MVLCADHDQRVLALAFARVLVSEARQHHGVLAHHALLALGPMKYEIDSNVTKVDRSAIRSYAESVLSSASESGLRSASGSHEAHQREAAVAARVRHEAHQREVARVNDERIRQENASRIDLLSMMNDSREHEARRVEHEAPHQEAQRRLAVHEALHQEAQRRLIEQEALHQAAQRRLVEEAEDAVAAQREAQQQGDLLEDL